MEKKVMRRVYAVWVLRQLAGPLCTKMAVLTAFTVGLHQYVSVKYVLHNSPSFFDLGSTAEFFTAAFVRTEAVSQVFIAGILALSGWLMLDGAKRISAANRYMALSLVREI